MSSGDMTLAGSACIGSEDMTGDMVILRAVGERGTEKTGSENVADKEERQHTGTIATGMCGDSGHRLGVGGSRRGGLVEHVVVVLILAHHCRRNGSARASQPKDKSKGIGM
jgi:hypothetical protein